MSTDKMSPDAMKNDTPKSDATGLNIERARQALARARSEEVAAAVRAPRPADLSRLQEEEARKRSIDLRAGEFRDTVRERLGLGDYRGPAMPTSSYVAGLMSAPLCDADVCMPVRPATNAGASALAAAASTAPSQEPAAPPRPEAEAETLEAQGPGGEVGGEAALSEDGAPYTPIDIDAMASLKAQAEAEAMTIPNAMNAPALKPRKKFLGIF